MSEAYGFWARNSAGDIVEMLMQMLEALAFIHSLNIVHRDAFRDNFVVHWHPESVLTMEISSSRPRVYLIDFEVAIEFLSECLADEQATLSVARLPNSTHMLALVHLSVLLEIALDQLRKAVHSITPESLLIKPWIENDYLAVQ